jgi:hypothetical protein
MLESDLDQTAVPAALVCVCLMYIKPHQVMERSLENMSAL